MKEKRAVIFDVDGLLLNTEFIWLDCWMQTGKDHDIPEFGPLFYKAVGTAGKDIEDMLDRELPHVQEAERRELMTDVRKYGNKVVDHQLALMAGAIDLLDYLEEKGYRKAVATTTKRDLTDLRLKKMGVFDRFEYILCGDEVVKRKPDPEIYQKVLAALDIQPQDALVLEDTCYGVEAASRAGCDVIMVPSINPPTDAEIRRAFAIVRDLHEVKDLMEKTMIRI